MDIVERLRQQNAEQVSEIVKLRENSKLFWDAFQKASHEVERLLQEKGELVYALQLALSSHGVVLTSDPPQDAWKANGVAEKARAALAKATGEGE